MRTDLQGAPANGEEPKDDHHTVASGILVFPRTLSGASLTDKDRRESPYCIFRHTQHHGTHYESQLRSNMYNYFLVSYALWSYGCRAEPTPIPKPRCFHVLSTILLGFGSVSCAMFVFIKRNRYIPRKKETHHFIIEENPTFCAPRRQLTTKKIWEKKA